MKKGILILTFAAVQLICLNIVMAKGEAQQVDKDKIAKMEKKKKGEKKAMKIYPINKAKR